MCHIEPKLGVNMDALGEPGVARLSDSGSAIRARGDIQQLKVLAASSSGIAVVSAYGAAARPI